MSMHLFTYNSALRNEKTTGRKCGGKHASPVHETLIGTGARLTGKHPAKHPAGDVPILSAFRTRPQLARAEKIDPSAEAGP